MKKQLGITLMFLCMVVGLNAQSKDEVAIREAMNEQLLAWNAGNIERYMQTYWQSDSLMFIGKSGVTKGWAQTLKNYKKGYPDTATMGKLDFTIITVKELSPRYYYVTGKWHLVRSAGDIGGCFTLLFEKLKGKWLIISDHSS